MGVRHVVRYPFGAIIIIDDSGFLVVQDLSLKYDIIKKLSQTKIIQGALLQIKGINITKTGHRKASALKFKTGRYLVLLFAICVLGDDCKPNRPVQFMLLNQVVDHLISVLLTLFNRDVGKINQIASGTSLGAKSADANVSGSVIISHSIFLLSKDSFILCAYR